MLRYIGIRRAAAQDQHQGHRDRLGDGHGGADFEQILAVAAAPGGDTGHQHTDEIIGGEPDVAIGVIGDKE